MLSPIIKRRIISGVLMFVFSYLARVIVSKIYPVKPTRKSYQR
jgi:hypothetical protein